MDRLKQSIEQRLLHWVTRLPNSELKQASLYTIEGKAKRFRPLVVLHVIESYGKDPLRYLDVACALECIHLYSLIHDDLPAMDDDSLRHGRPTLHLAFDEANAILVGDGFLTLAFEMVSTTSELTDKEKINAIHILSSHAGMNGMIFGQHLDLAFERQTPNESQLEEISHHKTGMLLSAAFQLGALIGQPKDQEKWAQIGRDLGLLFQIQDDVLEATTSSENMGKSKSDDVLEKATFVKVLGLEKCQKKMEWLKEKIMQERQSIQLKNTSINDLIDKILTRQY